MKQRRQNSTTLLGSIAAGLLLVAILTVGVVVTYSHASQTNRKGSLIKIYDRGTEKFIVTNDATIGDALRDAGFSLSKEDVVEPAASQKIVASNYQVNIYRARPVVVVDGAIREKVMTPYQTADQIARSVGISLYPEDKTTISPTTNIVAEGAGLEMDIIRATPFNFDLYGSTTVARTQAKTVGDMLEEKGIQLGASDKVSPDVSTPITAGMNIRVWREGHQTVTVQEPIPFTTSTIYDVNQYIGYKQIQTPGQNGSRNVTYDIVVQNGKEVSRTQLASIDTLEPVQQVMVIGVKSNGGLSKSKGVNFFTDSKGVTHRETYYDLNMSVVAQNCGNGGVYIVRADGVKVDRNGYILIAANLARYPRCSVVETSLGLGMVYDTGAFVATYPDGFDVATDWSNYNGI